MWVGARRERLVELWGQGLSASQIASAMHCTRNAVIGAAHRIGLNGREPGKPAPQYVPDVNKRERPLPVAPLISRAAFPEIKVKPPKLEKIVTHLAVGPIVPVHMVDLGRNQCRFMIGESSDLMFCGRATAEGKTYCCGHAGIVYKART